MGIICKNFNFKKNIPKFIKKNKDLLEIVVSLLKTHVYLFGRY